MSKNVRTRFAPSPTGYLHVGALRTALFKYLFAKNQKGSFILRIDDTDRERFVVGAEEHIKESLQWLGLDWEEEHKQSNRFDIYREYAKQLQDKGSLYPCWCSAERLDELRKKAQAEKVAFKYDRHCLNRPDDISKPHVLRFYLPDENIKVEWTDLVKGRVSVESKDLDDFVAIKSDGWPTYHFSSIVDDHLLEISHVVRGDEWVASTPKHLLLYRAFDWEPPIYAHVPPILGPDGKKKLSKRDGAKDILEYRNQGYLPEALTNFLATLGWNDGTEQEIFTSDELVKKFSLERVQKSGARFDEKRLEWISGHHVRQKPLTELQGLAEDFWPDTAKKYDAAYKEKVLGLVQERIKYLGELPELTSFFFEDLPVKPELITEHKKLKKLSNDELKQLLESAEKTLKESDFSLNDLTNRLNQLLETSNQKPIVLFSLIRIATTQAPASPGLAETLEILGKEIVLNRIAQQLKVF
jgi:glutamyl-tRNA synthetase